LSVYFGRALCQATQGKVRLSAVLPAAGTALLGYTLFLCIKNLQPSTLQPSTYAAQRAPQCLYPSRRATL